MLAWLSVIASTSKSVEQICCDHWCEFGRNYFARYVLSMIRSSGDWNSVLNKLVAMFLDMTTKTAKQSRPIK